MHSKYCICFCVNLIFEGFNIQYGAVLSCWNAKRIMAGPQAATRAPASHPGRAEPMVAAVGETGSCRTCAMKGKLEFRTLNEVDLE